MIRLTCEDKTDSAVDHGQLRARQLQARPLRLLLHAHAHHYDDTDGSHGIANHNVDNCIAMATTDYNKDCDIVSEWQPDKGANGNGHRLNV